MSRRLLSSVAVVAATAALGVTPIGPASSAVPGAAETTADVVCAKYAATNGSDGNDGTLAAPYRSLGKLVSSLQAGQTGCLPAGQTYYAIEGNGVVGGGSGTAAQPVTITSSSAETEAIVKGQLWLKPESHDIVMKGLNLHGSYGPTGAPTGTKNTFLILHGDRITIRNNDISNGRGICIGAGKAHASDELPNDRADDLLVTDNSIHGCGMDANITWAQGDSGAHGVYLENTLNAVVSHNLIYDNRYRGLQLWPRNNGAHIHHNVFDQNATHVNIGSSEPCAATNSCKLAAAGFRAENTKVYDNIFTNRVTDWRPSQNPSQLYGYFLVNSPPYGNEVYNNCFAPNDPAMTGDGFAQHDNQILQASFTDRAARNYKLLSNSHCLGKGPWYIQPSDPPVTNTAEPVISGTTHVGSTLTASGGTWNPSDVTQTYQWLRNGSPITNATATSYTLVVADKGQLIRVRVTATKPGYSPAQATSQAVGPVTDPPEPPVSNTSPPVINGTPEVGATLTTSGGTWDPSDVTKSYQWLRNGSPITGATASSYQLVEADEGTQISVRVTAAKSGHSSGVATSNAVGPITDNSDDIYRPDGLVKRAGATSYLGGGIYNRTGLSQTLGDVARRGERRTYSYRVENDGNQPDVYYLVGTGAGQGYTTRYYAGSVDITSDVVSGNYGTPELMPGASRTYKVVVKATSAVPAGTVRLWHLHAVSGRDPAPFGSDVRDTVRLRLRTP